MKAKPIALVVLLAVTVVGTVSAQGRFRNITSIGFSYYSDQRYGLDWEDVFIAPLPAGLYLITAANGTNASFSDITGGRLGLAFDLPGAFYGEGSYALEYDWREGGLLHSAFLSATYESGLALASLSLTGELTDTSAGGIASPSLKYRMTPGLLLGATVFTAFHHYEPDAGYFNFAFLGTGEYALAPEILFSLGGTFSTVYEPTNQFEKWSVLGGITVTPAETVTVKSQVEYTNAMLAQVNPHEIVSILLVVDIKFRGR
ncbi:MAG: hypothetical protein E4H20_09020 [Spirochaetales bacterium]|nr:MAG: hypothetical protein E4H20_09020 [Spirochaetales bacterium]